jgi:hypothetical protein
MRYYFVHLVVYNTMEKTEFKINIIWIRLPILNFLYFVMVMWQLMWITYISREVFILYRGDVTANMNHLLVKRIYLVSFSYIVIDDSFPYTVIINFNVLSSVMKDWINQKVICTNIATPQFSHRGIRNLELMHQCLNPHHLCGCICNCFIFHLSSSSWDNVLFSSTPWCKICVKLKHQVNGYPPTPAPAPISLAAAAPSFGDVVRERPSSSMAAPTSFVPLRSFFPPMGHRSAPSPPPSVSPLPSLVVPDGSEASSARSASPTCSRWRASPHWCHAGHADVTLPGCCTVSTPSCPLLPWLPSNPGRPPPH